MLELLEKKWEIHIADDNYRLAHFKRVLDEKPQDTTSPEFQIWVKKGYDGLFGYLFEAFWTKPEEYLNQGVLPPTEKNPNVVSRIGDTFQLLENLKNEFKFILCHTIEKSNHNGAQHTTGENVKRIPISATMWIHGGKYFLQDMGLDVSNWDEMGTLMYNII